MTEARVIDAKEEAKENDAFRKVLFTSDRSQLVVMSLRPGEDIGEEVHDADQLLYAVKGEGTAVIDGKKMEFEKGAMFCVPAGTRHNVMNTDDEPMKLFTVYTPPQHAPGTVHQTKEDAKKAEAKEPART
jgi:mannose-6-phosphate isomerase-like protein (cupin superfamily)